MDDTFLLKLKLMIPNDIKSIVFYLKHCKHYVLSKFLGVIVRGHSSACTNQVQQNIRLNSIFAIVYTAI